MQKKIGALKDHLVVAGVGRTGKYIVEELDAIRRDFVVIDKDEEVLKKLNEELKGRLLYVVGDATEDTPVNRCAKSRFAKRRACSWWRCTNRVASTSTIPRPTICFTSARS